MFLYFDGMARMATVVTIIFLQFCICVLYLYLYLYFFCICVFTFFLHFAWRWWWPLSSSNFVFVFCVGVCICVLCLYLCFYVLFVLFDGMVRMATVVTIILLHLRSATLSTALPLRPAWPRPSNCPIPNPPSTIPKPNPSSAVLFKNSDHFFSYSISQIWSGWKLNVFGKICIF